MSLLKVPAEIMHTIWRYVVGQGEIHVAYRTREVIINDYDRSLFGDSISMTSCVHQRKYNDNDGTWESHYEMSDESDLGCVANKIDLRPLYVCKAIYDVVRPVFYSQKTFIFANPRVAELFLTKANMIHPLVQKICFETNDFINIQSLGDEDETSDAELEEDEGPATGFKQGEESVAFKDAERRVELLFGKCQKIRSFRKAIVRLLKVLPNLKIITLDGGQILGEYTLAQHKLIWRACEGVSQAVEIAANIQVASDGPWTAETARHDIGKIKKRLNRGCKKGQQEVEEVEVEEEEGRLGQEQDL